MVSVATSCTSAVETAPPPVPAEAVSAPALTRTPAGTVVDLGERALGLAVDGVTGLVAVGLRDPDRVALVDRAGQTTVTVPLPGPVSRLALAGPGGPLLVPVGEPGVLLEVALPGGEVLRTTELSGGPVDAIAVGGQIVISEQRGALAFLLDGAVTRRTERPSRPGPLAAAGSAVAVLDTAESTLQLYDPATAEQVNRVLAGQGATALVSDRRDRLVVIDARAESVLVFDTDPLFLVQRAPVPGGPFAAAYDETRDRLWVTLPGRNEVVGLDLSGGAPREVARLPTVRQPDAVAVDESTGLVVVAGRVGGELQYLDP